MESLSLHSFVCILLYRFSLTNLHQCILYHDFVLKDWFHFDFVWEQKKFLHVWKNFKAMKS